MEEGLEFGCVPRSVVEGLQEIGNWKVRAAAVEALHSAVLGVRDPLVLQPTLSRFLQFLLGLVADPNFKISTSVMRIVQDLLGKLGADAAPYLGTAMEALIAKLADRNEIVRRADVAVMASLMQMLGPQPVLNGLGGAFVHPDWRVREAGRNVVLQALLSHTKDRFDYPMVVRAFAEGVADESERVRVASLEGLAVLHERLGPLLQGLLTAVGAPEGVKRQAAERLKTGLPTPYLNTEGQLEHQAHARPASAGKPKATLVTAAATPTTPAATRSAGEPGGPPALSPTCSGQPGSSPQQPFLAAAAPAPVLSSEVWGATPMLPAPQQEGLQPAYEELELQPQPGYDSPVVSQGAAEEAGMRTPFASSYGADAGAAAAWQQPLAAEDLGMQWQALPGAELGAPWAQPPEAAPPSTVWHEQPPPAIEAGAAWPGVADRYPSWSSAASSAAAHSPSRGPASDAVEGVEQSGDSLLRWVRPNRAATQSFSGSSSKGRPAGQARSHGASSPGHPASLRSRAGSQLSLAEAEGQRAVSRSSSFGSGAAARSPLAPGGARASPLPAALGADGYASVAARALSGSGSPLSSSRSSLAGSSQSSMQRLDSTGYMPAAIQHRRPNVASTLSSVSTGRSDLEAAELLEPRSPAGSGPLSEADSEVEGRSESLLLWRLPARPASNVRKAAQSAQPAVRKPPQGVGPATAGRGGGGLNGAAERSGSAVSDGGSSILQKLDGFKKKLFGSEAPVAPQQPQPQEGLAGPWSIPAMRVGEASRPASRVEKVQHEPAVASDLQPESPTKGAAKLSNLKRRQQEAAERRRVWSAPISSAPPSQRTTLNDPEDQPSSSEAPGAAESGVEGAAASPLRPGLQALKVRARTARAASLGALAPPPSSPAGQYGMDVLTDVFGPDRATLTTAWSPAARQGPAPARLTLATRAGSPGWHRAPGSPSSASSSPSSFKRLGTGFLQKLGGSPGGAEPGTPPPAFTPAAADLSPLDDPEGTLHQLLQALEQANASQRKELDWQSQYEALSNARRVIHNHASVLVPCLHQFVLAAAPAIDSLRSIPARLAITVFQDLIEVLGPALDSELDHLVPILLKKAGVVSVAGRDNFLAVEADRALGTLVALGGEGRVAAALLGCLASTRGPDIKAKIAIHLDACVQRHGHRLVASGPLLGRLLRAAVGFLDEGGLEARTSGKRILWELRRLMDVSLGPEEFRKALGRLEVKTDKVWDIFESGRPPPPARSQTAARSPSGGSPAALGFNPAFSPGAASGRGSLLAIGGGYPSALGEASLALGSADQQHSTYQYSSSPAVAAAAAGAASPAPSKPALRPTISFHTLTLGGDVAGPPGSPARAGSGGGAGSSAGACAPRRTLRPVSSARLGGSAAAAAAGAQVAEPPDPALQLQVDQLQFNLSSKDWKERVQALATLRQLAGQLTSLPGDTLLRVCDDLAQRVVDANLKVQLEALPTLKVVLAAGGGEGLAPGLNTLVPALAKALDSSNATARGLAGEALDQLAASMDAALYIQPLMQVLSASANVRSKAALLERLQGLVAGLHAARPQLVTRHVLPPLLAALGDKRAEVRGPVQGVLGVLAGCMGVELLDACIALAPAHRLMVAELVAAQQAGSGAGAAVVDA